MNSRQNKYENDDISLKDLILKFREFKNELFSNKRVLLLFIIPFVLFFSYRSIVEKFTYTATLNFMLNKSEGSLGGLGGILGQIGIGKGKYSKEKLMTLSKSRRIVGNAIFRKETINEKEDLLANHVINHLDSMGQWASIAWYKKPFAKPNPLVDFRFKTNKIDSFDLDSKAAFKDVYEALVGSPNGGGGMMSNKFNEESGIMEISLSTKDPELSIALANDIFDELSEFYINKTIEKQKATYDILKTKTDSIRRELSGKQAALAAFEDRAQGLWSKSAKLRKIRLQQEVKKLSILYGEVLKNLEIADFTLRNKTPFVQAIDRPVLPITGVKRTLVKSIILAVILGLILGSIFIIIRKIIRDALSE